MNRTIYFYLVGLFFALSIGNVQAQNILKGKVLDELNQAVSGATILEKSTQKQTLTNQDGEFSLDSPNPTAQITVRFLGYQDQTVSVNSTESKTIILVPSNDVLEEVVVTALGISREKKALGYAVQEVKSTELQTRPTNALAALSGKVAGLQVISSGGNMGGSTRTLLRGINSIAGSNQPLYVVDGTPIDNSDLNSAGTINGSAGKDVGNMIQDLNPDDIENISVLKGPSAAALYGSRAANGVILITTKRAGKGENVSIDVNTGLEFENIVRLPKRQHLYGQGYSQTFQTVNIDGKDYKIVDYASDESWGPKLDGTPVLQWYNLNPEDAADYLNPSPWLYPEHDVTYFFNTGLANTNNVAISGNSGQTNYRFSYTNKNVRGTVPNATLGRNTLNFSGGTKLGKLSVNTNINYIHNNSIGKPWTGASNRNIILEAYQWGAVQVDYKRLENYKRADGTPLAWNRTGWQNTPAAEATRFIDNPFWSAYESYLEEKRDRFYGNVGVQYEVADWLNVGAKVHGDIYQFSTEDRIAVYSRSASQYEETSNRLNEYNYEFLATAKKNWDKVSLVANVGANLRNQSRKVDYGITQGGLIIPNYYNLKNVSNVKIENFKYNRRIASVYASASLGYHDYLFLDATVRNDWSSTLPTNANSFIYPSFTGSFVFSQVPGFQADWLSFGKVRLGWAQVGNDTDPYQLYKAYDVEQSFNGLSSNKLPSTLNNSELKPEITSSWETGVNLQFFRNRLGLDVTYYNNVSRNQILPIPVSSAFGYEAKVLNAGRVENKGLEIILNGTPIQNDNFEWNASLNYSRNKNKVLKLDELVNTLTLSSSLINLVAREGQPYGQLLGYDFVYADGQRVVKEDGTYLRTSQLVPLGSVLPDYLFGFQNNFRYKNFNFGFLIDGRVGGSFYSQTYNVGMYSGILDRTAENNVREDGLILDGVKADVVFNPDGTYTTSNVRENDTRITAQQWGRNESTGPTTFSIFDGTFVKLREVTLGYNIPLNDPKVVKGVRISAYARNVWNIYTKSKYIDPEFANSSGNVQGIEAGNIPTPLTYGFNVNLKF
ncbi:SusC/RagA family TonB-linked outer membrane protein [Sphingobacterium daejeonense]|uniref:SusC/RagA family TonB-linked outer membrane protein n=1 Tax=Sphingobacterium daejeonense TaxID=371142 RepID=UPI0021A28B6C|nr:SusC/RagA family TonB-linked outer membrane protein [Sphingobacterium daejeonense]MCT1530871.1 SusC/RagA family TonB-linked outer membrane protein [Sphingobacterium daejeonense]